MPTISVFYEIIIQMFLGEHNTPHFHAKYGEFQALIGSNDFSLIEGRLPSKALALVVEWASVHQKESQENWTLGKNNSSFKKIEPLQ